MFVRLFKFVVLLLISMPFAVEGQSTTIEEGVLDLRLTSLSNNSIALNGFWKFYPNQLLLDDSSLTESLPLFTKVPSWWSASETIPPVQYGTYKLTIILSKEDVDHRLALKMPDVYSSYTLWINSNRIGSNGVVGTTAETSKPQWLPQTYPFKSEKDTLKIIVQLSNFHHSRSGINNIVYLGDADKLIKQEQNTKISGTILFGGLWFFALIAVCMHHFKIKKDVALLYYALLCISWSIRSIFSNHYLSVQWFPDVNWSLCVKVEYITLYLTTLFGSLLVGRLFPRDVSKTFRNIYVLSCALFTLFTIVTPPSIFTRFVQLYLGLSSILLISMLVIITKAYIEGRQGINNLIICVLIAVIMFAYVILAYQGIFELNSFIFNGGFLILFLLSGVATALRIHKKSTTFDHDIMTFEQLKNRVN